MPALGFVRMAATSVETEEEGHGALPLLLKAKPNPFDAGTTTTLMCVLPPGGADVSLVVYDASGRLVRTLVDDSWRVGVARERWDGRDDAGRSVAAGVYLCKALAGERREIAKLVLLR
ncbi:MAG: hypothetical protein KAW67_03765 [Candidatus Eisenbacteria sp.]|nr:hypothetical protein [Candidatus Eisenbacteria bacterium]